MITLSFCCPLCHTPSAPIVDETRAEPILHVCAHCGGILLLTQHEHKVWEIAPRD
jgi:hypothetical protein